jgi:hypothetical protein
MTVLIVLIVLLVVSGAFGGYGYYARPTWYGPGPQGLVWFLFVILLVALVLHVV